MIRVSYSYLKLSLETVDQEWVHGRNRSVQVAGVGPIRTDGSYYCLFDNVGMVIIPVDHGCSMEFFSAFLGLDYLW